MATKNLAKAVFTLTVAAMLDMILFRWYIYRIYKTQNLEKLMMGKVREKHARYKKNAIAFWRKKIVDCYSLQAQVGIIYIMLLSDLEKLLSVRENVL